MSVAASDLGRSVVVSVLTCVLGTGLAVAVNFATEDGAGLLPWVVVVVLTALSALLAIAVHPRRRPQPGPPPYPPPGGGYGGPGGYSGRPYPGGYGQGYPGQASPWPGRRASRTVSWVAVLLTIALIVGGASGVAYAGWYGVGWLTGNQTGEDVLVQRVSATAGPLTVTVDNVEITRHFTKIDVTAANRDRQPLSLPLFGNCQLDAGGSTLGADDVRSDWNETVPAGGTVRGTITFNGKPAEGVRSVTLSFATVYSLEGGSITVPNIPIRSLG